MEGGAYVTPGDYAKLLLMHLRGGRCGDEQVLSQAALDRMHADRIGPTYGTSAGTDTGYGMGWWVDRASGQISDPGAYGSFPWLDLDDGYGAYLVIEADSGDGRRARQPPVRPGRRGRHGPLTSARRCRDHPRGSDARCSPLPVRRRGRWHLTGAA